MLDLFFLIMKEKKKKSIKAINVQLCKMLRGMGEEVI